MKLTNKRPFYHPLHKMKIVDVMGKDVGYATSFDTVTKETTLLLMGKDGLIVVSKDSETNCLASVEVVLHGAKAVWKDTGEEILEDDERLKV